jgi:uncharacterized membrane protein
MQISPSSFFILDNIVASLDIFKVLYNVNFIFHTLNVKVGLSMKVKALLAKKNIEPTLRRYGVEAMGSMALGLFASLIIGVIFEEIGKQLINASAVPFLVSVGEYFIQIGAFARGAMGYAVGIAVAYGLKAPPLVLFASAVTGFAGAAAGADALAGIPGAGPAGAFIAAVVGAEFGKLVSKETKVDIIVTPAVTLITGIGAGMLVGPPISRFIVAMGELIMWATDLVPFVMGALVAMVIGIVLTGPISSVALTMMLGLEGIAAGAAVAGCCANMIGFAVISYRENKWSGLISQGLGTSMLQMPNIVKNPRIWIPPIAASAVVGAISAGLFHMTNTSYGAGMGTSGLVGQFGALSAMGYSPTVFAQIALVHFILPAVLSLLVSEFMRKKKWIKFGDMKLEV